ncbi:MAG TPA: hypothetical protein VF698_04765, partial [Thermoanaerobaculia bacterium]
NDTYEAPADGKLTDAQMKMYLKVRQAEAKIAQVARKEAEAHAKDAKKNEKSLAGVMDSFKTMGSVADMLTADIRAAKELGYNTQEYLWVKQQVLEVSGAAMAEQMNQAMSKNFDQAYAQTKKAYDEATDENTKKMYAEMLAGYDKSKAEMAAAQQNVEPHVKHNRELVNKYENELAGWAHEMAKWSDKPEDAKKAVEDLNKAAAQGQGQ